MKPKDLKAPFAWNEREVMLNDRVLYVPDYLDDYASYTLPSWSDPAIFGNRQPVHVEYCSGNGAWIAEKALRHPEINWVAVERQFKRVKKIWSKLKNLNLTNLFVICGEGRRATAHYIRPETVAEVYVNFPDPWPKKRHAKNRIIQPQFVAEVLRILAVGGFMTLVTDDPVYSEEMLSVVRGQEGFAPLYADPGYATVLEGYGSSYFDALWREKGKTIRYHRYQKDLEVL